MGDDRAEDRDPIVVGEARRLADYVVDKRDRGRSRPWLIGWLAISVLLRSGLIGSRMRVMVLRAFGARIGDRSQVRAGVRVHFPWKFGIGNECEIGAGVWIINPEAVTIGDQCVIGSGAVLCSGGHDHRAAAFTRTSSAVLLGRRVRVGANALVLKGTVIADDSVIEPNSVVLAAAPRRAQQ